MRDKKHHIDIIFIIVLIGLFALSSTGLALLGVNIYKNTGADSGSHNQNTAALYFAQKVRQCEDKSQIRTAVVGSKTPDLVIGETSGGQKLETWFYVHDNNLKEVTVKKGSAVDPQYGQTVMEMSSADFEIVDGNLLQITMSSGEDVHSSVNLYLMGGHGYE